MARPRPRHTGRRRFRRIGQRDRSCASVSSTGARTAEPGTATAGASTLAALTPAARTAVASTGTALTPLAAPSRHGPPTKPEAPRASPSPPPHAEQALAQAVRAASVTPAASKPAYRSRSTRCASCHICTTARPAPHARVNDSIVVTYSNSCPLPRTGRLGRHRL